MKVHPFALLLLVAALPIVIFAVIIVGTGLGLVAWQPPIVWSHSFGTGESGVTLVCSDYSNIYAQGYSLGGRSLFLNKWSLQGGSIWSRVIGSVNGSLIGTSFTGMSVAVDGIYLVGFNYSGGVKQGILLKFDLTGIKLWEKEFGSAIDSVFAATGGIYVTGNSLPITNQSYTGEVTWVREYDFAGNVIWTQEYSNDTTFFNGVYASSTGIYISYYAVNPSRNLGPFLLRYDLNGAFTWMHLVELGVMNGVVSGIASDSTGEYLSGTSSLATAYLSKIDPNGNQMWTSTISSPDLTEIGTDSSLALASSGAYVLLRTSADHQFLEKYDLNGHFLWKFQMQNPGQDPMVFRLATGSDSVYFAGSVFSGGYNSAIIGSLSPDPSLVFFGLNPPWSFILLGGLIGGSVISVTTIRKLRRKNVRPA